MHTLEYHYLLYFTHFCNLPCIFLFKMQPNALIVYHKMCEDMLILGNREFFIQTAYQAFSHEMSWWVRVLE